MCISFYEGPTTGLRASVWRTVLTGESGEEPVESGRDGDTVEQSQTA